MPRVTPLEKFIEHALRRGVLDKRANPGARRHLIDRLVTIAARKAAGLHWAYMVDIKDFYPRDSPITKAERVDEQDEPEPAEDLDKIVQEALAREQIKKSGG